MQSFTLEEDIAMINPQVSREEFEQRMSDMTGFINTAINNASGRIIVQVDQQIAASEQKILQMVDQRFQANERILARHEQELVEIRKELRELHAEVSDIKRFVLAIAHALNIQNI